MEFGIMKVINNHMDISLKFAFMVMSEFIHHYFGLEGEYVRPIETEVITLTKHNLRMDIAYLRNQNIINNLEIQSSAVNWEKLKTIAEYVKFLLIHNGSLVDCYVISKVDPALCEKEIHLTKTLILRLEFLYKSPEEILKSLNTLTDKVENKINLSDYDASELAMLPVLAQDEIAFEVTKQVCHLIKKDKSIDDILKAKICFILDIMIDRNIPDEKTKKELQEMINMEKRKDAIDYLLEQSNKELNKELEEKNEELEEKNKENRELKEKFEKESSELKKIILALVESYPDKDSIPKSVVSLLLKL